MTILSIADALEVRDSPGGLIVDTRPAPDFCAGHPSGAMSVPFSLRGLVERTLLVAPDTRIVVIAEEDEARAEAAQWQFEAAGVEVAGTVRPVEIDFSTADEWDAVAEVSVEGIDQVYGVVVVDVREPMEWEMGIIEGARLVPLGGLRDCLSELEADRKQTLVAICEGGIRSATAASILKQEGFADVAHVPAGMNGYRHSGRPMVYPEKEEKI